MLLTGCGNQFSYLIPNYLNLWRAFLKRSHLATCSTEDEAKEISRFQLSSIEHILRELQKGQWMLDVLCPFNDLMIDIKATVWPSIPGWEATITQNRLVNSIHKVQSCSIREKPSTSENSVTVWRSHVLFYGARSTWNCLLDYKKEAEGIRRTLENISPMLNGWYNASQQLLQCDEKQGINSHVTPVVYIRIQNEQLLRILKKGFYEEHSLSSSDDQLFISSTLEKIDDLMNNELEPLRSNNQIVFRIK